MAQENNLILISQQLINKTFLSIPDISSNFNLSSEQVYQILEELDSRSKDLGLTLEVIELQGIDYIFYSIPSSDLSLSSLELGVLAIFGLISRSRGGNILNEEIDHFFKNNATELHSLVKQHYLIQSPNIWQISPLGASTILPLLPNVEPLIKRLLSSYLE